MEKSMCKMCGKRVPRRRNDIGLAYCMDCARDKGVLLEGVDFDPEPEGFTEFWGVVIGGSPI